MSLHNLATVFGPTLLRPAAREQEQVSMDQLFSLGARDAMLQTGILLFFLNLKYKGVDFVNGSINNTRLWGIPCLLLILYGPIEVKTHCFKVVAVLCGIVLYGRFWDCTEFYVAL